MLLATTIMLLVFRSPSAIISVMWIVRAKMFINEKPPFPLRKFHSIANLCATVNAATTFIMFIIYGTKFRSEFTRIYCCILTKVTKSKRTTIIRQEQQQMKQFISKNKKHENEEESNDSKNKTYLLATNNSNEIFYKELSKRNSSTVPSTAATSVASFSPMKRLRKQRFSCEQEYDLIISHNHNAHISKREHEIPIREDECNGDRNDSKSISLTESYFDWFKNLIVYR